MGSRQGISLSGTGSEQGAQAESSAQGCGQSAQAPCPHESTLGRLWKHAAGALCLPLSEEQCSLL